MTNTNSFSLLIASSLCLAGCGGGGSPDGAPIDEPESQLIDNPEQVDAPEQEPTIPNVTDEVAEAADKARYLVTLENMWGAEDFPQGFPSDGHLSLVGGATHNTAVSFWNFDEIASLGIEDMAETGRIDILLFDEVTPAIANGTADSTIEIREYTEAKIDGVPGSLTFTIEMNIDWPLISLVTMLGPSPDWFVGVSGLSLHNDGRWVKNLSVDLPLYDGGTKSDITPTMGGPNVVPPNPVALVAYDVATGVYLPSSEPQNVARLTFDRINSPLVTQPDVNQTSVVQ